jgi:hypothetical protein
VSTSTAAAPPAISGADGPEPVAVPEATGVLSVVVPAADCGASAAGADGVAALFEDVEGFGFALLDGLALSRFFAGALAPPEVPADFENTTSEHE